MSIKQRRKYPAEVAGTADALEAAEVERQGIKTATAAAENELRASGGTIAEPSEPVASKAWA